MSVVFLRAGPGDAAELNALLRPEIPPLDADYLAGHAVVAAWEGSRLAGFFALEARGAEWWLAHLWVAEASRGRGRGRWLLVDAVRRARRLGAERLCLVPDPAARPFFARLGARPDRAGRMEIDLATWTEPLPESVSELGSSE